MALSNKRKQQLNELLDNSGLTDVYLTTSKTDNKIALAVIIHSEKGEFLRMERKTDFLTFEQMQGYLIGIQEAQKIWYV